MSDDKERQHCTSVAWELMGVFDKPSTDATLREVADLIQRERAAAREQALEEALALCTTSKPLGPGMHELPHREDIERGIRALKVPR